MKNLKKIVAIGPESTGKSSLCRQLAKHYNTSWCPEYAREYLLENGKQYSYDSLLTIAEGQVELDEEYIQKKNNPLLFIDTDMYVMKVWCEVVFGKCHPFVLQQIINRKYDLYLLCNTDLPWVKDELREYPDPVFRQKLFKIYKDLLVNQSVPWQIISGKSEERLQNAIRAVEEFYPVKN